MPGNTWEYIPLLMLIVAFPRVFDAHIGYGGEATAIPLQSFILQGNTIIVLCHKTLP